MGAILMALGLLAATAGVPWLHGADGTHVHHAAATDACDDHGPCHGHGDDHDEGHHHEGHHEHDAPVEDGPTEHEGSCVTCVQLHLLTCTPPAAGADRAPAHALAAWIRTTAGEVASPAWRRVLPPGRGPPDDRAS